MKTAPVSLKELNNKVKTVIKSSLDSYWLIAEISEISVNYSGHCYLEFIQKNEKTDRLEAKSRAIIWSNTYRMIQPYFETTTGQKFTEGIKVMVRVVVEYHEIYGLSLTVMDIEPTYTVGEVALRKKKILEKLEEEGVLEMNKELELPYLMNRIAIVSSKTAAGLEDFLVQLKDNPANYKFYTKLFPAVMQGNEAEASIINQLDKIFKNSHLFDAVVVIRGGGSQSDLDCFNNYWLAYNIAQFPIPVLTGIGHEQDDSVADAVAHTRLKTPTAVAEFLVDHFSILENDLLATQEAIVSESQNIIAEQKADLKEAAYSVKSVLNTIILREVKKISHISSNVIMGVKKSLFKQRQDLDLVKYSISSKSKSLISLNNNTIQLAKKQLASSTKLLLSQKKHSIENANQNIELNNPLNILKKGFSYTMYKGESIKDAASLKSGDELVTVYYKGESTSIVK